MPRELTVVVTGATGKQGGAVARGLLERGHKVRAVTRDPDSSQAKSLANAGATLVGASLEDTTALAKALEGATSLFAMTTPAGGPGAETREIGQGVAAADAARAAGVHLVFTSVGSANRQTGIPHFDSKYEVEKHIAKVGVHRMGEDGVKMYEWLDRVGYTADRAALRREFPDVAFHDFESWAKAQDWRSI